MEKRITCSKVFKTDWDGEMHGHMCEFASSAKFHPDESEPYWECKKFKVRLEENENRWLKRCDKCIAENFGE